MKSTKNFVALLVVLPVLTLGAGLAVGVLAMRMPASQPVAPAQPRTFLVDQLHLSSDQQVQMQRIWESAQSKVQNIYDEAQKLQTDRDNALYALLDKNQQAEFDKIAKGFADRRAELDKQRDQIFQDAVQQSKSFLNPTQITEYNQLLKTNGAPIGEAPKNNG